MRSKIKSKNVFLDSSLLLLSQIFYPWAAWGDGEWGLWSIYNTSFPPWALQDLQLPSRHIRLLWHGVLHGLQCGYLIWCGPSWAGGCSLVHHALSQELQEILCSRTWSMSSPLYSLTLVSAVLFLSLFSHFSRSAVCSILKYVFTEMPSAFSVVGPFWSQLKVAVSGTGHPGLF